MRAIRILRGALGLSIMWGAAWGIVATASYAPDLFGGSDAARQSLSMIELWATYGAITGFAFAAILVAGRRRTINALALPRVALWGAMSGAVLPVGLALGALARSPGFFSEWNPLPALIACAGLGAVCAMASTYMARRADRGRRPPDSAAAQLGEPNPDLTQQTHPKTREPRSHWVLLLTNAGEF